jgi:S-adenosylmethionine:tRNA ribosyltransferase-isomerase
MILTDQFDFHLPNELIAQRPVIPRDQCRLMVINRLSQNIEHRRFFDLGHYLKPKDLVVINDSRVIPARFFTKKKSNRWENRTPFSASTPRALGLYA